MSPGPTKLSQLSFPDDTIQDLPFFQIVYIFTDNTDFWMVQQESLAEKGKESYLVWRKKAGK